MVDDEIGYDDIVQQYQGTIVLFKGKPVYVKSVDGDKVCNILDLGTQKLSKEPFSFEHFKPPTMRMGLVNIANTVVMVSRQPYRKMQVGISGQNMHVTPPEVRQDENNQYTAIKKVRQLAGKELYNTIVGDYPSFEKALDTVSKLEVNGAVAFDRQFAITSNREILYKTQKVGTLPVKGKTVEDIKFDKGFEYVAILIGDNCEKTLRATRKS